MPDGHRVRFISVIPQGAFSGLLHHKRKPKRKLGEKNNQDQDGQHQQHKRQGTLKTLHQRGILDHALDHEEIQFYRWRDQGKFHVNRHDHGKPYRIDTDGQQNREDDGQCDDGDRDDFQKVAQKNEDDAHQNPAMKRSPTDTSVRAP